MIAVKKSLVVIGIAASAAIFWRLGYVKFGDVSLFGQNTSLCQMVPGDPRPQHGSGACYGNFQYTQNLPTANVSLLYDSNFPRTDQDGVGMRWRASWEMMIWDDSRKCVVLANGTVIMMTPISSPAGFVPTDPRQGDFFVARAAGGYFVEYIDGTRIDLTFGTVDDKNRPIFKPMKITTAITKTNYTRDSRGRVTQILTDSPRSAIDIAYSPVDETHSIGIVRISSSTDAFVGAYEIKLFPWGVDQIVFPDRNMARFAYQDFSYIAGNDRLIAILDVLRKFEIEYRTDGRKIRVKEPNGLTARYTYDDNGTVTSTFEDPGTLKEVFESDGSSPRIKETTRDGIKTQYKYNTQGSLVEIVPMVGPSTVYEYLAPTFDVKKETTGTVVKEYTYAGFPFRRVTSEKVTSSGYSSGASFTTLSTFEWSGKLLSSRTIDGRKESYTYNSAGILESVKDWTGRLTYNVTAFAPNNQVLAFSDIDGRLTSMTYTDSRLASMKTPDGVSTFFTYDSAGNVLTVRGGDQNKTFTYDNMNRANSITSIQDGRTTEFRFTRTYGYNSLLQTLVEKSIDGMPIAKEVNYWGGIEWVPRTTYAAKSSLGGYGAITFDINQRETTYVLGEEGPPVLNDTDPIGRGGAVDFPPMTVRTN